MASTNLRLRKTAAAFALPALVLLLLSGCRTTYTTLVQDRDTIYQVAPFLYLLSGNYDGTITASQFKAAGTLGIGTFEGLDGEAVMIDGLLYHVKGDGSVDTPEDSRTLPYGASTLFDNDQRRTMKHIASYDVFCKTLESHFEDKQIFYAIRADGYFKTVRVRSCDKQTKPYRPLADVTKTQHEYTYERIRGSLVGFWTPPTVPGSISVPGFHMHFISDDRKKGGHVLDFQADTLNITLDPTPRITIDFSTPIAVPLLGTNIEQQVQQSEGLRK